MNLSVHRFVAVLQKELIQARRDRFTLALMIGMPLAFALAKVVGSSLFGVTGLEPGVVLGVALVAVATAVAATSRAARVAVRTDIAKLLRQD